MLKNLFPLAAIVLLLCGCANKSGGGGDKSAKNKEVGFTPLFNGSDLNGWTYGTDAAGAQRKAGKGYQIRDGSLYCTVADGGNLFTKKEYGDFVLRLDVKLTPGANNGVAIRSPLAGNPAYEGIEIQVLDDTAEKYAKLRPEQYHGSVYDVAAAERGHLKPLGEWNQEEITAQGRHIIVKLNGHTIVDTNLDDVKDEAKLKKHPGLARPSGHIGFLGHGAEVEFKNVRIKELP
jgi:hypothetical protein